ncbi:class F sortase [Streptomyces subrutilus]|uniref:class F sortase n=1 Tax=Streptomyces subrutilus TaxID=36818 RepID=UPI00343CC2D7
MPRAKWAVGALTVTVLAGGLGVLRHTEGARPAVVASATDDALPSRALGLSGHRRLVRQLEHSAEHRSGAGARSPGSAAGPLRTVRGALRPARPLRLRIPSLGVDVPLSGLRGEADWEASGPAPGAAGTAVVTWAGLGPGMLRRGRTIEIPRADGRTAVFTVVRVSPGQAPGPGDGGREADGRGRLRLVGGETAVLARLTGQRRTR